MVARRPARLLGARTPATPRVVGSGTRCRRPPTVGQSRRYSSCPERVTVDTTPEPSVRPGMLILAGGGHGLPLDYDELERWTRVGYERGMRSRKGER
jgi:hypothetical protein